jgi:hypothetical protein
MMIYEQNSVESRNFLNGGQVCKATANGFFIKDPVIFHLKVNYDMIIFTLYCVIIY